MQLRDIDEVPDCEPTAEMPPHPDYEVMYERPVERPTIPMQYHGIALDTLESLITRRNRG